MKVSVYIGTSLVDLFPNENIEVNSSVVSISDITKNLTDFTRTFTVPASSNNNKLFKHYYNANIDNTFDARTKVNGRIELNGMPFKYGKFRLERVQVKQGNPYAYSIQFWGNGINLKDKLKNDELSSLDFSAYNHEYNATNVKAGLIGSLFSGDLVYSLLAKKQYYYNSNGADAVMTSTLANIAYNNGGLAGIRWSDLNPSIKLLPIIEAIESKYNIAFSRDFFGRDEIKNIHLWLNNNTEGLGGGRVKVDFVTGSTAFMNYDADLLGIIPESNTYLVTEVTPAVGFENVPYKVIIKNREGDWKEYTGTEFTSERSFLLEGGTYELEFYVESKDAFSFSFKAQIIRLIATLPTYDSYSALQTISGEVTVNTILPKIKTIDFLRGLFQMFKLIVLVKDDGTIYVNSINDYYAEGKLINLTKYVDSDNYEVERGKLLNPINFGFEQPETLLNKQFKTNNGEGYGDEELILEDEDGQQLDGESFDVKLPFEQILYERLNDLDGNGKTNIIYGGVFDDKIEAVNPKPHLHYVQNSYLSDKTIGFINELNVKEELTTANIPLHSYGLENPQYALLFGNEFSVWNGAVLDKNLYSNYYESYITSVFNIKKRSFKYTGVLPLRFQLTLGLNDVIQIRNNYFRIDSYVFNLITKQTTLNLVNSFDNTLNSFTASRSLIITDYLAKSESIFVTNGGNFSFNKVDTGNGTTWASVSNIESNVYFNFIQNTSTSSRTMQVEITNTLTLQTITITLIQTESILDFEIYTADNNTITADNNTITADNG